MNLGETVPAVCSETCLTHSADGSEVCDLKAEEVPETQKEEDPLAIALPAIKAEHEVSTGASCRDYIPEYVWNWFTAVQRNSRPMIPAPLKAQHPLNF
jgi:hypothetical protein